MKLYYLHNGQVREGPYSFDELKERGYAQDTPVWHEGLTTWVPAGTIEELREENPAVLPPYLPNTTRDHTVSEAARFTRINSRKIVKGFVWGLALMVLTLAGIYLYNQIQKQRAEAAFLEKASREMEQIQDAISKEAARKAQVKNNIATYVTAQASAFETEMFGGISDLEITVRNDCEYLIDRVTVKVMIIKANGEVHRNSFLDFHLLQPHSTQTLPVESSSRGVEVKYEIVSITSKVLGL